MINICNQLRENRVPTYIVPSTIETKLITELYSNRNQKKKKQTNKKVINMNNHEYERNVYFLAKNLEWSRLRFIVMNPT